MRLSVVCQTRSLAYLCFVWLAGMFLLQSNVWAATENCLGAAKTLAKAKDMIEAYKARVVSPATGVETELKGELAAFRKERDQLSPEIAAARWLAIFDRFYALPTTSIQVWNPYSDASTAEALTLHDLLSSLPPPAVWNTLKEQVFARQSTHQGVPEAILRVFVLYLTRDSAGMQEAFSELQKDLTLTQGGSTDGAQLIDYLKRDAKRQPLAEGHIEVVENFKSYLQNLQTQRPEGVFTIQVPDLVPLIGETESETLLMKVISTPGLLLNIPAGGATLALAKKLITEHPSDLVQPQWQLVTSPNDTKLYEAMARRFPDRPVGEPDGSQEVQETNLFGYNPNSYRQARANAKTIYILGLVSENRVPEAVQLAMGMAAAEFESTEFLAAWHSFDKQSHRPALLQFCKELLVSRPELPLWKQYLILTASSADADSFKEILTATVQRANLSADARMAIRGREVDLLLASDQVDECIMLLKELVRMDASAETPQVQRGIAFELSFLQARLHTSQFSSDPLGT